MDSGNLTTDATLVGNLKGSIVSGIDTINVNEIEQEISGHTANINVTYDMLPDKPSINDVELTGELSLDDLGIDQDFVKDDSYVHTDNNYTTTEKTKLASLENYDDTDIKSDISSLQTNKADKSEIPDVSNFITKSVNDLTYYTLATNTGSTIELSINSSTYVVTLSLKNSAGTVISTGNIDLPLESVVVNGSYDSTNKKIILTLQSGSTIDIPVGDLINGLQSEITSSNKLSSDLVDDTNHTNKFVTASEKQTWNNKSDFSGSYTDLTNKPTIPDELADLQEDSTHRLVTDAEKTTWNGKQDALIAGDNITISNNVISATGGSSEPYVWDGTDTPEARQKFLDIINNYTDNGIVDYNAIVLSDGEDVYHMTSFSATKTEIMTGGKFTFTYYYTTSASENPLVYSKFVSYANLFGNIIFDISNKIKNKLLLPYNNSTSGTQKVLTTDNQQSFTPTANYHPATKKYVDDSIPDISGKQDIIQYSTVPTASSETVGKIIQFTGTTDNTYTNGYFYKGISTAENNETTYSWQRIDIQPHQDISGKENASNKVTSITASSTDTQYPSAKCVFDALANAGGGLPVNIISSSMTLNLETANPGIYYQTTSGNSDYGSTNTTLKLSHTYGDMTFKTDGSTNFLLELVIIKKYSEANNNENYGYISYIDYLGSSSNISHVRLQKRTGNGTRLQYCNTVNFLTPAKNYTISGKYTYNTLPESSVTPTTANQLTNKNYVDNAIPDISGKLDTSKVKSTSSTTSGDVYDVTYINSVLGDISTALSSLVTVGGGS